MNFTPLASAFTSHLGQRTVVCSSKLLEHLNQDAKHDAVSHLGGREHSDPITKSVQVCFPQRSFRYRPFLNQGTSGRLSTQLLLDLLKFHVDGVVVCWSAIDFHHRGLGLLDIASSILEARRFREEQNAGYYLSAKWTRTCLSVELTAQNDSPNEADADRDLP